MSRLAAFALDVGASCGAYTLVVAAVDAAVKLISRHSYTLSNHQTLSVIVLAVWAFLYLHLPVGGERQDAGHGDHGPAGGDGSGRPISGDHAVRRTIGLGLSILTLGIGALGIVFQRQRRALDDSWPAPRWSRLGRRAAHLRWLARTESTPQR